MKRADGSGATLAVIIGDDEAAAGEQHRVALDQLADAVNQLIFEWEDEDGSL